MKKHVQGSALVQAIVGRDGRVERMQLLRSFDAKYGLDEEALVAARQWTFNPATRDGQPVRMLVAIELSFTLRK
jgi:TonB family protein